MACDEPQIKVLGWDRQDFFRVNLECSSHRWINRNIAPHPVWGFFWNLLQSNNILKFKHFTWLTKSTTIWYKTDGRIHTSKETGILISPISNFILNAGFSSTDTWLVDAKSTTTSFWKLMNLYICSLSTESPLAAIVQAISLLPAAATQQKCFSLVVFQWTYHRAHNYLNLSFKKFLKKALRQQIYDSWTAWTKRINFEISFSFTNDNDAQPKIKT